MSDEMGFIKAGEVELPEGYEGRELHFYISRGKVEIWLMPANAPAGAVEAWLAERKRASGESQ
ncbi:MAG: hypothetical protein RDV48_22310 [Candidatus Eremiobacteraeota bacterium]|nr:hypothetical protein [Candidatus Eremiobacteraeota bacterium]